MTKPTINFEDDVFNDVDDTSLKALADKCQLLELAEKKVAELEDQLKERKKAQENYPKKKYHNF